jgi:hypothetical protein
MVNGTSNVDQRDTNLSILEVISLINYENFELSSSTMVEA